MELKGEFISQTNDPHLLRLPHIQHINCLQTIDNIEISLFPEKLHFISTITYCENNVYDKKVLTI